MSSRLQIFEYKSPIGIIYCLFDDFALIGVSIEKAKGERLKTKGNEQISHSPTPAAYSLFSAFDEYFKGDLKEFRQEIKFVSGTAFERRVWLALRKIPYGQTRSYKWLAEEIGLPKAVRAVGQALKKNPLPIILPCHRVVASDGSIGGFSCGVDIKKMLLMCEGAPMGRW